MRVRYTTKQHSSVERTARLLFLIIHAVRTDQAVAQGSADIHTDALIPTDGCESVPATRGLRRTALCGRRLPTGRSRRNKLRGKLGTKNCANDDNKNPQK